jgi:hypothetical protein
MRQRRIAAIFLSRAREAKRVNQSGYFHPNAAHAWLKFNQLWESMPFLEQNGIAFVRA